MVLDRASAMSEAAINAWLDERGLDFDEALLWSGTEQLSPTAFVRTFKVSGGKVDTKPIGLSDVALIQQRKNRAAYAFTLQRYSYTPADPEGCNGMFTHDEFWGYGSSGYIASFENNKMKTFRGFPEWFADS